MHGCSPAVLQPAPLRGSAKCRAVTAGTPDHLIGLEQSVGNVLKANRVMVVVRELVRVVVRYENDWKRSMTISGGVNNQMKCLSLFPNIQNTHHEQWEHLRNVWFTDRLSGLLKEVHVWSMGSQVYGLDFVI